MESTIKQKIQYLNSFFNYFYINQENFSKNIQLQLNLIKPLLKLSKEYLSSFEKEKLIFVQSQNLNKILKNTKEHYEENKIELINLKKLDLLLTIAKRFNMDLKYNKDKIVNNFRSNEIDFEKQLKDINFDILLKTYQEKFGEINEKISVKQMNPNFISEEDLINNKNIINNKKIEIDEIAKKNQNLDLVLYDLKRKLNNFKDLPTEVEQMKKLIEIKKEEYKALLIDKK